MSSAGDSREREVIAELIDLYRDLPCLWDTRSECYKDARQRKTAWEVLLAKYKEIDGNASEASVKKKIDTLKFGYHREAKKVKASKTRTGSAAGDIHKPNLWYYDLMTFLEQKTEANRSGVDTIVSEDEDDSLLMVETKRGRRKEMSLLESKKMKLLDSAQGLMMEKNKEVNSFGVYIGEKLEQIQGVQREMAEKLISDVVFLAKMNQLTIHSKVYTPPNISNSPYTHSLPPHQIQSFPQFVQYPQSPTSSFVRFHHPQSSVPQPQSPTTFPQPTQSPTSSFVPFHNSQPSVSQPQSAASLPQPIQSSTSFHARYNPRPSVITSTPQHQSLDTSFSYSPTHTRTFNINTPTDHDYDQMDTITLHQSSQEYKDGSIVIEGPAGEILKEMLIFKK